MQDTGCLGLVHWDDPEGWCGEGGGRGVQDWEHMYTRGRFMLMYEYTPIQYCKVKKKKIIPLKKSFGLCGRGRGWDDLGECIETCILSYMKRAASPGSMYDTGCRGMVQGEAEG